MWVFFTLNFIRYSDNAKVLRYGHASLLVSALLGVLVFCLTNTSDATAHLTSYHPTCNLDLR